MKLFTRAHLERAINLSSNIYRTVIPKWFNKPSIGPAGVSRRMSRTYVCVCVYEFRIKKNRQNINQIDWFCIVFLIFDVVDDVRIRFTGLFDNFERTFRPLPLWKFGDYNLFIICLTFSSRFCQSLPETQIIEFKIFFLSYYFVCSLFDSV